MSEAGVLPKTLFLRQLVCYEDLFNVSFGRIATNFVQTCIFLALSSFFVHFLISAKQNS